MIINEAFSLLLSKRNSVQYYFLVCVLKAERFRTVRQRYIALAKELHGYLGVPVGDDIGKYVT